MRNKYNAKKTMVDGYLFDSMAEAKRYQELKLLERAKKVCEIEVHPQYPLEVNGERICIYEADFRYIDVQRKKSIVEDVKGAATALYKLKKKLMRACLGIEIEEVRVR